MRIEVREARLEDAEAISRVDIDSHREAYRHIFTEDYLARITPEGNIARWQKLLSGNPPNPALAPSRVIVAIGKDVVVGYAGLLPSRDEDAVPGIVGEIG